MIPSDPFRAGGWAPGLLCYSLPQQNMRPAALITTKTGISTCLYVNLKYS